MVSKKGKSNQNVERIQVKNVNVYYGSNHAIKNVSMDIKEKRVTALIGPSGCGKSTLLRSFNRMNDEIVGCRTEGSIIWGGKIHGIKEKEILDKIVEKSLKDAAIWDEVRDRLGDSAMSLSGGQQQRLCIARTLAIEPEIILMDEPCSALDPIATAKIEDLINQLKKNYTVVIVTHNMQQAARVSDYTGFFYLGELIEYGKTKQIFENPKMELTENYMTGRFG